MRIAFRQIFIAGVAGYVCGKGYNLLRQHPDTVRPILQCSVVSGATGLLLGWGVSAYRNLPTHVYTLSLGANFAVVGGTFIGIRGAVLAHLDSSSITLSDYTLTPNAAHYMSSAISGTIAGALSSIVSRHGFHSVLGTGCVGLLFGVGLQFLLNMADVWRRRKAIKIHYPELVERKPGIEWSLAAFERRFMNFWNRRSEAERVETEIALLQQAIREEKQRIAELDRILEKRGTPSHLLIKRDNLKLDKPVSSELQSTACNVEPR